MSAPSARRRFSSCRTTSFPGSSPPSPTRSGVLPHSISEMLRKKGPDQLSPYEAVLRYFGYLERATPEEHAKARDALERAVENAPDQANCWATLAMVYRDEHTHGFNVRPDPLGRALAAAHRAVEAAPSNHLAHLALASALVFPEGDRGVPERGGANHRAQPDGLEHHCVSRDLDVARGRLGTWLRPGGTRQATQSQSSRMVLVRRILGCLPQAGLPRRARGRPQDQHAGRLLCPRGDRGRVRTARRAGSSAHGPAAAARDEARLCRNRARGT